VSTHGQSKYDSGFIANSANKYRFYYRGDTRLPQDSPPLETAGFSPATRIAPVPSRTPIPKRLSAAPSGKSNSPGSIGFPDSLYIPRSRALRRHQTPRQDSNVVIHEESVFSESLAPGSPLGSPIGSPIQYSDVDAIETIPAHAETRAVPSQPEARVSRAVWSGSFNPTPQLPYLTVDKHKSATVPKWRTPSFNEAEGVLSQHNRQILFFCIGFVFPLGLSSSYR